MFNYIQLCPTTSDHVQPHPTMSNHIQQCPTTPNHVQPHTTMSRRVWSWFHKKRPLAPQMVYSCDSIWMLAAAAACLLVPACLPASFFLFYLFAVEYNSFQNDAHVSAPKSFGTCWLLLDDLPCQYTMLCIGICCNFLQPLVDSVSGHRTGVQAPT